ncbi:caspase family protein [Microbacterium thalassium]|uniref:WD40 repeat protein n=1 Tax=Microbacterium thalassium TaxID=362649 RepID=A0A7X0FM37_9MICO|nr:caspase family protein [Microbacterium thalassium]MBB6390009.1 WD40 repeat protein [Microbacterium thalassium]GLK24695.1 hypothetical protein GCM10017607_20130 [Microbacterium thalassium]
MGEYKSAVYHVSQFGPRTATGGLAGPDSLDDLPAANAAQKLLQALAGLGYSVEDRPDLTAKDLGQSVFDFVESGGREDVRIVHVCSHGVPAAKSEELYIIGSDGKQHRSAGVEAWVREIEDNADTRALTLFVIDACYAGRAAELAWQLTRSPTGRLPRAIVLAASAWNKRAYEFHLSTALAGVLSNPQQLDISSSQRFLPWATVFERIADEMVRHDNGTTGQRPYWTPIGQRVYPEDFPFFPNPDYRPPSPLEAAKAGAPVGVGAFVDGVDVGHFLGRAANDRVHDGSGEGLFRGRTQELQELSAWLDRPPSDDHLRMVTGSPGSGKSALLGMLVCAGLPTLREFTRHVWGHAPHTRNALDCVAAVHARGLSMRACTSTIAQQLGLRNGDARSIGPADLLDALQGFPKPPTIILDALDEAADVASLVSLLVLPLIHARRQDGSLACRLLIGTRAGGTWTEIAPLTAALGKRQVVNLDDTDVHVLTDDLQDFIHDTLAADERWGHMRASALARIARNTALALTDAGRSPDETGAPASGEFLVASLYVDYLRRDPSSTTSVLTPGRAVPTTLPGVLALDLATDPDDTRRRVLTAFALAHGDGVPIRIATEIMRALFSTATTPAPPAMTAAIESVRFYLRSTTDIDGTNLYRLFHQSLTDSLVSAVTKSAKSRVLDQILAGRTTGTGEHHWVTAGPYLTRHVLAHAQDAGRTRELLADTELLVAAKPESVRAALRDTRREPREIAAIYSATPLDGTDNRDRRDILVLNARRYGLDAIASRLSGRDDRPVSWAPRWSTGSHVSSSLIAPLAGHVDDIAAVACTTLDDRPVAVTGSWDRTVRVWDLTTGGPLGAPLKGHAGPVNAVACTTLSDRPVAVTGSDDDTVRIWDLTTGQPIGGPISGHRSSVVSIACTTLGDRPIAVSGSSDRSIRIWDLTTAQPMGEPLTGHEGTVNAVACTTLHDHPVAVTGSDDGTVRIWDLTTRKPIGKPLTGHTDDITAIACTTLNDVPIAVTGSSDHTARVWDLATRQPLGGPLTGHRSYVTSVACATIDNRPVAVTGSSDRSLHIWDLTTGQPLDTPLTGHTDDVTAIACTSLNDHTVAISGSSDLTARLWDLTTGGPVGTPQMGHARPVNAVACTTLSDRPVAVTGSNDRTVRIWDLTTGQPIGGPISGHRSSVVSIACTTLGDRPIAVSGSSDRSIRIWDLTTAQPMGEPLTGHEGTVNAVACTTLHDHPVAVTGSDDGTVRIWDLTTRKPIGKPLTGHDGHVTSVACTTLNDVPIAVTGGWDQSVRVWELGAGKPHGPPLRSGFGAVNAVACATLDGRPVAVAGSLDGVVRAWDLATGRPHDTPLTGHKGGVTAVVCTFLDDHPIAITGGSDHTIRVWEIATGKEIADRRVVASVNAVAVTSARIEESLMVAGFGHEVAAFQWQS